MNYALQTLKTEINLIKMALSTWETEKHPEAKKEREKRLKELEKAVKCVNMHDELVEALKEAMTKIIFAKDNQFRQNFKEQINSLIKKATE